MCFKFTTPYAFNCFINFTIVVTDKFFYCHSFQKSNLFNFTQEHFIFGI